MLQEDVNKRERSLATEGARRATGVASEGAGIQAPVRRWSRRRKQEVVLRILRGESLEALSRELGVEVYRLVEWRDRALTGLEEGLRERAGDPLQAELDATHKRIGELSMKNELLEAKIDILEGRRPLARRRSKR